MPGFSDYLAQHVLEYTVGKTAMPALPTVYVALFTTASTADSGTGAVEVTGGAYARVATSGATWAAAGGSGPSSIANAAAVTFPASTAAWGTIVAWGLYDASTGGNLLAWDYLGAGAWQPFTCTAASPGVLTVPAHGLSNGALVVVDAEFGGTLPATAGSWAGLLTVAGVTTDTFTAGVNTTGTGNGLVRSVTELAVGSSGITPAFGIGALTLALA